MKILIFKTNIRFKKDLKTIAAFLETCPVIEKWNVDLKDTDKVLRVQTTGETAEIIQTLSNTGYTCEELPD